MISLFSFLIMDQELSTHTYTHTGIQTRARTHTHTHTERVDTEQESIEQGACMNTFVFKNLLNCRSRILGGVLFKKIIFLSTCRTHVRNCYWFTIAKLCIFIKSFIIYSIKWHDLGWYFVVNILHNISEAAAR